jgi:hypothetical protein
MIRQTLARKRSLLLLFAAVVIAFAGVGSYLGWQQVDAQVPVETCNDGIDNDGDGIIDECVLILDTSVTGGMGSPEALAAQGLGFGVDLVTPTDWALKTTSDFAKYRAIILGDPTDGGTNCSTDLTKIGAATANASTWGAAATGNIVVIGTDPVSGDHPGDPGHVAGEKLTKNAIAYATSLASKTGVYISLSCYYFPLSGEQTVDVLSYFGTFKVLYGETNAVQINDPTHPVVQTPYSLTAGDLSAWGSSIHEQFTLFPGTFTVVASDAPIAGIGRPYILANGRQRSITTTFTSTDTTELFVRDPTAPDLEQVSARLTFAQVNRPFNLKFTFTTVSKMVESARLDPAVFGPDAQCLSYDSDAKYCVRHTVRLVDDDGKDIGVPVQGTDFTGNFRLELAFHDVDVKAGNIGAPFLAQAKHNEIETPLDLYDRDVMTSFRFNSCNCVGVAETDGFSDFIMGERVIPAGQEVNFIGPLPPIKLTPPLLVLKAGQALPVKFRLTDSTGAFITSGVTAMLDIWQLDPSGQVPANAINRAGTQFVYNYASNVWERITDTAGWPKGDYVGVIRSVYVSPESVMFSPVKFNFSIKK